MRNTLVLVFLFALFVIVRIASPIDFFEGDQAKQVGYVMDILHNGNWLVQYEVNGQIATKPPLYSWLAALTAKIAGTTAPWVMKLPSLLGGFGLLIILYMMSQKLLSQEIAFWATISLMASHHFMKLAWFARTDMLMVFFLYAAVYTLFFMKSSWYKSLAIGFLLGVNYLIKGPAGPAFFAIILVIWSLHNRTLFTFNNWIALFPGFIIFCLTVAVYLSLLWEIPQFHEDVIRQELLRRTPLIANEFEPVYNYVIWLFGRVFPWPIVAIAAIFFTRRESMFSTVRLITFITAGILIFLSFLPDKRHDYLLPVYPFLFMLVGLGLYRINENYTNRCYQCLLLLSGGALLLFPIALPFLMKQETTVWILSLAVVAAVFGALAISSMKRRDKRALTWFCAGLIIINGLYHYGLGNSHPLHLYKKLQLFIAEVKQVTGADPVRIWNSHPLISYELGTHKRISSLNDLKKEEHRIGWLITDPKWVNEIEEALEWRLSERAAFIAKEGKTEIDARFYQILRKH